MLEVRGEGRPEAGAQPSCRAEIHGKNLIYNLFVCVACMFFFFRRVCFLPRLESGDMVLPPEETGSQWHKVWNVSGRLS